MEVYAQQAKNTDAERKAANIRVRAERRVGEILALLKRVTPQDAAKKSPAMLAGDSPYREALELNNISDRTGRRYQQLAKVPREAAWPVLSRPALNGNTMKAHSLIESELRDLCAKIGDAALYVNPYDDLLTPARVRLEDAKQNLRRYIGTEITPYVTPW